MKLTLRKEIGFYEITPTGYRPAWVCAFRGIAVCYPFGIHYVAMLIRWLWKKTWWIPFGKYENELFAALRKEYERGRKSGRWEMLDDLKYHTWDEMYEQELGSDKPAA